MRSFNIDICQRRSRRCQGYIVSHTCTIPDSSNSFHPNHVNPKYMFVESVGMNSNVLTIQKGSGCILSQRFNLLLKYSAPPDSLYLFVIDSTKLVKVIWNFLHGCFFDMGLILLAPNEIFNLSDALVSRIRELQSCTP